MHPSADGCEKLRQKVASCKHHATDDAPLLLVMIRGSGSPAPIDHSSSPNADIWILAGVRYSPGRYQHSSTCGAHLLPLLVGPHLPVLLGTNRLGLGAHPIRRRCLRCSPGSGPDLRCSSVSAPRVVGCHLPLRSLVRD